jgi:acyl-CoA thioesterase I
MRCLLLLLAVIVTARAETLAFFGDSLTAGYGLDAAEAYPALVGASLATSHPSWRVVNAGVSGDTTAGGLRRVTWLLKQRPDLVVVALGANDGLRGIAPAVTRKNLVGIVKKLRAGGARVAIAGMELPTNFGAEHRTAFRAVFSDVAKAEQAPLLPFLLDGVAMVDRLNLADRIHPNAAGHKIIADKMLDFVRPLLAAPTP